MNRMNRALVVKTVAAAAAAYSTGDQVGIPVQVANIVDMESGAAKLVSLTVVDEAAQAVALDVLLFKLAPTVTSADNDALAITDAEMTSKCLGVVSVAAADFKTVNTTSTVATVKGIDMVIQAGKGNEARGNTSIWAIVVARGSPTYAASSLTLKFGVER